MASAPASLAKTNVNLFPAVSDCALESVNTLPFLAETVTVPETPVPETVIPTKIFKLDALIVTVVLEDVVAAITASVLNEIDLTGIYAFVKNFVASETPIVYIYFHVYPSDSACGSVSVWVG